MILGAAVQMTLLSPFSPFFSTKKKFIYSIFFFEIVVSQFRCNDSVPFIRPPIPAIFPSFPLFFLFLAPLTFSFFTYILETLQIIQVEKGNRRASERKKKETKRSEEHTSELQ